MIESLIFHPDEDDMIHLWHVEDEDDEDDEEDEEDEEDELISTSSDSDN